MNIICNSIFNAHLRFASHRKWNSRTTNSKSADADVDDDHKFKLAERITEEFNPHNNVDTGQIFANNIQSVLSFIMAIEVCPIDIALLESIKNVGNIVHLSANFECVVQPFSTVQQCNVYQYLISTQCIHTNTAYFLLVPNDIFLDVFD